MNMKKNNTDRFSLILWSILILVVVFFGWNSTFFQSSLVWAEKNSLAIRIADGPIILAGDINTAKNLMRPALQSRHKKSAEIFLPEVENGIAMTGKNYQLQKINDRLSILQIKEKRIFVIQGADISDFLSPPVDTRSDVWIVLKNGNYQDLPMPSSAIVFLGNSRKNDALNERAKKSQTALLSAAKLGGILLKPTDQGWDIKARKTR